MCIYSDEFEVQGHHKNLDRVILIYTFPWVNTGRDWSSVYFLVDVSPVSSHIEAWLVLLYRICPTVTFCRHRRLIISDVCSSHSEFPFPSSTLPSYWSMTLIEIISQLHWIISQEIKILFAHLYSYELDNKNLFHTDFHWFLLTSCEGHIP